MRQPSLFDPPKPAQKPAENLEPLRRHLHGVLRDLRHAEVMPWGRVSAELKEKDFLRYASALPEDEREPLVLEFYRQLSRVRLATEERMLDAPTVK
ncbi:MAG: hypothetical protein KGO94_07625 [Alphaproteobacteria bacterium]|nr:hypothetical protein [Alphaproteobacteria bacterium]